MRKCALLDAIFARGKSPMKLQRAGKPADTGPEGSRLTEIRLLLREEIALRIPPWPLCRKCGERFHPEEFDPIYQGLCGACGDTRAMELFRRLANARGRRERRTALRALKRFASGTCQ